MRKLMWFVLGFAAACALLVHLLCGTSFVLCLVGAWAALILFLLPQKLFRRPAVLALGFAVGALWCTGWTLLSEPAVPKREVSFTAVASACEEQTAFGSRVEAEVTLSRERFRTVLYYVGQEGIRPGDLLTGRGEFRPTAVINASEYDLYDRADGIVLTGNVEEMTVQAPERRSLKNTMALFSLRLKENLHKAFPQTSAGYFTALVTGDRSGLSYGFRNRMSICGLYHAVSLSGMHVSVLMGVVLLLCGKRRLLSACLGIPVLVLFVLLSGVRPATVRAALMYGVLLFSGFVRREYDPLTALSAALLPLLVQNPWCIAQWGLQLSFLSTAGILLLFPRMVSAARLHTVSNAVLRRAGSAVLGVVGVSLSATALSLPLMAAYFGLVSLVAPLTNLLALWSVMVCFVGGIVTALAAFVSPAAAGLLGSGLHLLYLYLEQVLHLFSRLPLASVSGTQPFLMLWAFLWYALLTAWLLVRPRWYVPAACAAAGLAAALCLTVLQTERDGFTVLDVGQGQSIVCARGDTAYLIDCGGRADESGEIAARYLLSRGRKHLDGLILTHFDSDHCNGVAHLLERIRVDVLYYPAAEACEKQTGVLAAARAQGVETRPVTSPVPLSLEGGRVTLYPVVEENSDEPVLCILASAEECDILVTGDLSAEGELRLLADHQLPDLEVLVAGHHGSAGSTGRPLLEVCLPERVLFSVGENSYGHPAPALLERIGHLGAEAFTTLDNGNLTVGW